MRRVNLLLLIATLAISCAAPIKLEQMTKRFLTCLGMTLSYLNSIEQYFEEGDTTYTTYIEKSNNKSIVISEIYLREFLDMKFDEVHVDILDVKIRIHDRAGWSVVKITSLQSEDRNLDFGNAEFKGEGFPLSFGPDSTAQVELFFTRVLRAIPKRGTDTVTVARQRYKSIFVFNGKELKIHKMQLVTHTTSTAAWRRRS